MHKITILGSTGSIGKSTLSVVEQNADRYQVFALTAHRSADVLFDQCCQFSPKYAVVADEPLAKSLQVRLQESGSAVEVLFGASALCDVASDSEADTVMAAIVGAAGLLPTLAAVESGKRVLLANKEALVMSGHLFTEKVKCHNAELLPIDSEHNAIFQCLPERNRVQGAAVSLKSSGVSKILLTGSGGPFRTRELSTFSHVTPDEACAHPNWSMGRKISVDSATMMNKGLEFIEACWLFDAKPEDIEVVIHPQSVIHSMVQYVDGSVLAQMGNPDMRTPIAHCLAYPDRVSSGVEALDFMRLSQLTFDTPDYERFPCLKLAIDVASSGADYAVALNAANEIAVDLFLNERIKFTDISSLIAEVLEKWESSEPDSIDAVIEADQRARQMATAVKLQ
ncbi:MAG: 1-deoxy-D-xylulose-5-phosphate reductoisomerase [Agarilytica sp.]